MSRPLASVLLVSFVAGCASGHRPMTGAPDPIDALFADYSGAQVPGASVIVVQDGTVVLARAYGMADLAHGVPATTRTGYRLASVTKQFTAMAIMLLVRDGKLGYDLPVRDILPEMPRQSQQITIRNLLNHTSGILDYEDLIPDTQTVQVHDADVLRLLSARDSMNFAPGTHYRYSNSGYCLLALVVERVSGMPFARFLHERIFAPLGMTSSVAHQDGVDTVPNRAYGVTPDSGRFLPTDQSVTSATLGDGGIYTSVLDLVRWDQALYPGGLLDSATLLQATTPPVLPNDSTQYGFGWFIDAYRGVRRWRHTGETSGFRNAIQRFPDRRFTVIILTNRNGGDPATIAERIADQLLFHP
jgi:CubicO group peptidase (beta-lactamase class C family)